MKWLVLSASLATLATGGVAQENQDVPCQDVLKPGLVGRYWSIGNDAKSFPADLECEPAAVCRVDGMIDFDANKGRGFKDLPWKDHFGVIWTGVLRFPKDADYVFTLDSRDGSKLYLDGKLVLDHDGYHPPREIGLRTVTMTCGDHEIRLEHYQNAKAGRCVLSWQYEGVEKQVIPSTAFWHKVEKGLDLEAK